MTCQIEAKVVAHSVGHPDAPPITTFQLRYPRIIHSESKTHRVLSETEFEPETPGLMNDPSLSRNARSSRAVPVPRLIEEVKTSPFIPRYWGANQKGMQASEECNAEVVIGFGSDDYIYASREEAWRVARDHAVDMAQAFHDAGYHKQVVNRLLEPFMHIDVVVTGTQWANFFALRDHEAAEPHIRDLARAMKAALAAAGEPLRLEPGEWHLPYVTDLPMDGAGPAEWRWELLRAVSVTRCAQVSYVPFHEARLTIAEEIARHDQLVNARPMHASPAEHQATPDTQLPDGSWANAHLAGNLGPGWIQYRKTLSGESA